MEEIKSEKFENQIKEFLNYKNEPKNKENSYDLYFNKHKDSLIEIRNNPEYLKKSNLLIELSQFINEHSEEKYLSFLYNFYFGVVTFLFCIENDENKAKNILDEIYQNLKKLIPEKDEINNIINIFFKKNKKCFPCFFISFKLN